MNNISIALAALACLTIPASAQQPRSTAAPIGALEICIRPSKIGAYALSAIAASKCLSSSCQRFLRSTLKRSLANGEIRITGDLIHRMPPPNAICTRDCGGARHITLQPLRLRPASYRIIHNGKLYGAISVSPGMTQTCVNGRS